MAYPCLQSLKVAMWFSNLNFSQIERVTTHYQTIQTWIGHNVMRYHNFISLPYALPHALLHIFSWSSMVWGYLQRVTTRYRQIDKKIYYYYFKNIDGNSAQNQANPRENIQ